MDKETVKRVIDELATEYGFDDYGYFIELLPEDPHMDETIFLIDGPNNFQLRIDFQIPYTIEAPDELKSYLVPIIRIEAMDFDIDDRFDDWYHPGGAISPAHIINILQEDKDFFDSI